MKKILLGILLATASISYAQQYRPSNTSVTVYNPYPTQQNYVQPNYKHFNTGVYLGVGGVIDEPMNQRVVGSILLVGDSYTATSVSTSFNQMTDKMEYTVTFYIKIF